MKDFFSVLFCYIKQHIKIIIAFFFSLIAIWLVYFLYRLEIEAVFYTIILWLAMALPLFIVDFYKYYKLHKQLNNLYENSIVNINQLPQARNLLEQDYYALIEMVHNEKNNLATHCETQRKDLLDYYTLWVHQIKTPIASMRLNLQLEDNEQNNLLSTDLFKIEQYVEMVLTYLRLDNNSSDFVIKKYNLDEIVKQSVRKYAPLFVHKKIALDYKPLNCEVLTDEKWLAIVIEQIFSNSLKYTNKGKISIYKENAKTLVIKDTGIGISAEDLPRIFEKGFTGYNGRTDKKATGLGLYLCKCILNKLSHKIKISSAVSVGTKVMIDLENIDIFIE